MIENLEAVLCISQAGVARLVRGALPDELTVESITALREAKPVIRRVGARLLVVLPVAGQHVAWLLSAVPAVTDLPPLIERLQELSPECLREAAPEEIPVQQVLGAISLGTAEPGFASGQSAAARAALARVASPALIALEHMAGAEKMNPGAAAQVVADACVEAGIARAAIVALCDGREGTTGVGLLRVSDRMLDPVAEEIRQIIASYRPQPGGRQQPLRVRAEDLDETALDAALLARMTGAAELLLDLPAKGFEGVAVQLVDPSADADTSGLADLVQVAGRRRNKARRTLRARIIKGTALAAALVAAVWLVLPAPLIVTATALSQPAQATTVNLPFDAYLRQMNVEVGQSVEPGQVIARFAAPELEEQVAQAELQIAIEKTNAQAALAENDYGAYVLSEQRQDAQQRQLDQLRGRLDQLEVRSPISGRVISAVGNNVMGRFLPTGEAIATLQPDDAFAVSVSVTRVDAPLLKPGLRGEVYFRGLSDQSWPLVLETPVAIVQGEQGGQQLSAWARLEKPGNGQLIVGLTGFARLQAGETMRIRALSRYVVEWVKVKTWQYLGLHW